jgi:RNA polymerase sigma-70 factor (ECF subfamily)
VVDRFPTTRWSVVLSARDDTDEAARGALASLCNAYWFALYAYVRRRGHDPESARDLVQGYFVELIDRGFLRQVRPDAGRFRAFLLHTMKHYLSNEALRAATLKRGGGTPTIKLDAQDLERRFGDSLADHRTPESEYERQWALTLVERVMDRLERDAARKDRAREFARIRGFLTDGATRGDHDRVAAELSMSPGTLRVTIHRLRRRFGQFLREEIAGTVADPGEIDDEIRHLFAALGS